MSTTTTTTGPQSGARSGAQWAVRCPDFMTKPRADRMAAERELKEIVRAGNCWHDHEVVEVER